MVVDLKERPKRKLQRGRKTKAYAAAYPEANKALSVSGITCRSRQKREPYYRERRAEGRAKKPLVKVKGSLALLEHTIVLPAQLSAFSKRKEFGILGAS